MRDTIRHTERITNSRRLTFHSHLSIIFLLVTSSFVWRTFESCYSLLADYPIHSIPFHSPKNDPKDDGKNVQHSTGCGWVCAFRKIFRIYKKNDNDDDDEVVVSICVWLWFMAAESFCLSPLLCRFPSYSRSTFGSIYYSCQDWQMSIRHRNNEHHNNNNKKTQKNQVNKFNGRKKKLYTAAYGSEWTSEWAAEWARVTHFNIVLRVDCCVMCLRANWTAVDGK